MLEESFAVCARVLPNVLIVFDLLASGFINMTAAPTENGHPALRCLLPLGPKPKCVRWMCAARVSLTLSAAASIAKRGPGWCCEPSIRLRLSHALTGAGAGTEWGGG